MNYETLRERALKIADQYDAFNTAHGRPQWNRQQFMAGFVGDVGDLSKLVMAKEGVRVIDDVDEKLAHELSDCLWAVLVLAAKYDIDLPAAFAKTMDGLEQRIADGMPTK